MGKLTTYVLVLGGIILLFWLSGTTTFSISPTGNTTILDILKNPQNIDKTNFVVLALSVLGLAAAIWIGIATKDTAFAIKSAVVLFLFNILFNGFIELYSNLKSSTNEVIALLLFSPLILLLVITVIEWLTGSDNG